MNNCQFPMYLDPQFLGRTLSNQYNGQVLKIITTKNKEEYNDVFCDVFNYLLYINETEVCKCQTIVVSNNPQFNNVAKKFGHANIPTDYIWLTKIATLKDDYRQKGYASVLLNQVVSDTKQLSDYLEENFSILFTRLNTSATIPLYNNFNAEENIDTFRYPAHCPMIIKTPKNNAKYLAKTLSENYILQEERE